MFAYLTSSIVRYFNAVVVSSIVVGLGIFSLLVGFYSYDTSMNDLRSKTANTGDLASISLSEPIWNFETAVIENIFSAILLDADVVAIRVLKAGEDKTMAERRREAVAKVEFEELLKDPRNISSLTKIKHDDKDLAEVQIVTSTQRVKNVIRTNSLLIAGFALSFVILISGFIWVLGMRIVQIPINKLRASADRLADGHLDQEINTERKDELGSLAMSFDTMRNSIRKKLADLALLNQTGEQLAGIHDQTIALETAIKVVSEQAKVGQGCIYLLDQNKSLTLSAVYPPMAEKVVHFPKSFALGEGVVGKAATSGKIEFVPPGEKSKALLSVPMMDDQKVFGIMNFVGDVSSVRLRHEDEGFALTVARMAVITVKNIQMLSVIEEQNRNLEERILERTAQLHQKTNDVNTILQNLRQGVFTIGSGGFIHSEYSAYLTEIFETTAIANLNVLHFLFDRSNIGSDVLSQISATLDSLIGEDSLVFDVNSHLLVREYTKFFEHGRSRILELDWNPVLDADDRIDKLMVTVRDITELKALQQDTERQKEELNIIGQILAISSSTLQEFISTSNSFFAENKTLIEQHRDKDSNVVATLFRNMHTVKGNARTHGLTYVTDCVHETEATYNRLRSEATFAWSQQQLLAELEAARVCVERYEVIFNEKLAGIAGGAGAGMERRLLDNIAQAVENVDEQSQLAALKKSLSAIKGMIASGLSHSIGEVLKSIVDGLPTVARQLNKETPEVDIRDYGVRLIQHAAPMVRNVFMHLFHNSLDHGLESTPQRLAVDKPSKGCIKLEVSLNDQSVVFEFEDDGPGLALDTIYKKAVTTGQVQADQKMTDEEIAGLIFLSGLSTAENLTQVSGRGVGMDAIKQFLQQSGGDIQLVFTAPAAAGYRRFKQVISLPSHYAVKPATRVG